MGRMSHHVRVLSVELNILTLPNRSSAWFALLGMCFAKLKPFIAYLSLIVQLLMSFHLSVSQNLAGYPIEHAVPAIKMENMHHPIGSVVPNAFIDGRSSLRTGLPSAVGVSSQVSSVDNTTNLLSAKGRDQIEGMNGGMVKSEVEYSGSSLYMFGADGSVLEARTSIADAAVASFSSVESTSQGLNEPLLGADTSSFGFLGQIPRNFSLSDLAADFSHSSGLSSMHMRFYLIYVGSFEAFFNQFMGVIVGLNLISNISRSTGELFYITIPRYRY